MIRRILPALAIALAAACGGGGDPAGPGDSEVGTYTLRTVNGAALPAFLGTEDGVTASAMAGALTLRADHTFSISLTLRGARAGTEITETFTSDGSYTAVGNTLTLVVRTSSCACLDDARMRGSYASGSVRMVEEGYVSVYTR